MRSAVGGWDGHSDDDDYDDDGGGGGSSDIIGSDSGSYKTGDNRDTVSSANRLKLLSDSVGFGYVKDGCWWWPTASLGTTAGMDDLGKEEAELMETQILDEIGFLLKDMQSKSDSNANQNQN